MVSLDERGQVIIATSIVVALLILSLTSVLFIRNGSELYNYQSKTDLGDYTYYDVRETYKKVLLEFKSNESIDNPFNHPSLSSTENDLSQYCMRHGYFLSFENKSYDSSENIAEVKLVFVGEEIYYREVVRYEL